MSVRNTILGLSGGVVALVALAMSGADAASIDSKFNAAVERLLMNMNKGPVSEMSKPERKELVACVQKVFAQLPDKKKTYVAEASSESELQQRFDEVGLENKAALKQQVRDQCS